MGVSKFMEYSPKIHSAAENADLRMQPDRKLWERPLPENEILDHVADIHAYFGIHHLDRGWVYREWAPDAGQLYLAGEFNNWDWTEHPMMPLGNGCWVLYLSGDDSLWEGCRVKTLVETNRERTLQIPLGTSRITQGSGSTGWCAEVVDDRKA